ncbi:MAG: hypothetical protein ACLTYN_15850 [Dysosmobacter welbionis]
MQEARITTSGSPAEYTSAFRTYTSDWTTVHGRPGDGGGPDGRRVLAEQLLDLLEAGWKRQRP